MLKKRNKTTPEFSVYEELRQRAERELLLIKIVALPSFSVRLNAYKYNYCDKGCDVSYQKEKMCLEKNVLIKYSSLTD